MLNAIDHIEMIVRDVDEYAAFLQKLGFELLTRTDHHGASVELRMPGGEGQPIFEIHQASGEEVIGVNHIAFRADDVNAAYKVLSDKGVDFATGPRYVEPTGRTNLNFRDPDGWRLQIVDAKRKMPG